MKDVTYPYYLFEDIKEKSMKTFQFFFRIISFQVIVHLQGYLRENLALGKQMEANPKTAFASL